MSSPRLLLIAALLSLPGAAQAQHASACTIIEALPVELAGWDSAHGTVEAAVDAEALKAATLPTGHRIDAALKPTSDVRYIARPEKPGGSVSYGGMFNFRAETDGTYRVALGSAAWIDVLNGETAVVSTAHGHGPVCSGIRKIVDFPLKAGPYTLQIAANGKSTAQVMVARLP
jgi:hypothetical protein